MSKFLHCLVVSLIISLFVISAAAQDKDVKSETPKDEKSAPTQDNNSTENTIDLDSFFKKGEENAENGASCNEPAVPADPIS